MSERINVRQTVVALVEEVERLRADLNGQRDVALVLRGQLDGVLTEVQSVRESVGGMNDWLSRIDGEVGGLRDWLTRIDGEVGGLRDWLRTTSERTEEIAGRLAAVIDEAEREDVVNRLHKLEERVAETTPLEGTQDFTLESFEVEVAGTVRGYRDQGAASGSGVYLGFEDFFRGSEELIRERQRPYVALLKDRAPVLDVGCGRGEMLELLREAGIAAEGIDIDEAMIERCRAKGLTAVSVDDAVARLERAPDASLGAVFAAQVIEHLPYDALVAFFRQARRVLRPGGALLVETVNPHAPQALKHFWIDPTHQHPLFPEVVLAICRLSGFEQAFIWYPGGSGDIERDRLGQMDYTVVADVRSAEQSAD